jgi:hypothetical protein
LCSLKDTYSLLPILLSSPHPSCRYLLERFTLEEGRLSPDDRALLSAYLQDGGVSGHATPSDTLKGLVRDNPENPTLRYLPGEAEIKGWYDGIGVAVSAPPFTSSRHTAGFGIWLVCLISSSAPCVLVCCQRRSARPTSCTGARRQWSSSSCRYSTQHRPLTALIASPSTCPFC